MTGRWVLNMRNLVKAIKLPDGIALFGTLSLLCLALLFPACVPVGVAAASGGGGGTGAAEPTFRLGGTVSGLSGTLVLQLNGGHDITISGDGEFAFDPTLENGKSYVVTVFSRPIRQNVSVSNGSGWIYNKHVTDILVECVDKVWTYPSDLDNNISPDAQNAWYPSCAMDNNGNALLVWEQYNGQDNQIFMSEYRDGVWTHPEHLQDNISLEGNNARYVKAAMDNNGNALVVWEQSNGSTYQIYKSEYRDGIWTHPQHLGDNLSPEGQDAGNPQVAMSDSGHALVVWTQSDGMNDQIFKSEYRDGVWTHPEHLKDNICPDGQDAGEPQAAMDEGGDAVIVWTQSDGTEDHIYKSEYHEGMWTYPFHLGDHISREGGDAGQPDVAMESGGDAIVVWKQAVLQEIHVYKSVYQEGVWTHPAHQGEYFSPAGGNASHPDVAMEGSDHALVVWKQTVEGEDRIFKSEYREGVWTHPSSKTDYISPTGPNALSPKVSIDPSGNAIVVWMQLDGSNFQIFKSECWEGTWFHPADHEDNISPDGQPAGYPQVAMDHQGNVLIGWAQPDGNSYQIFKSEFR
jgi:hypothetical protein